MSRLELVHTEPTTVALPATYDFADPATITSAEVGHLFWRVYKRLSDNDFLEDRAVDQSGVPLDEQRVGVRARNGNLVGYGVLLVHTSKKQGELGNFLVHPDHRSRGIGKAIITERMQIAEFLGVTSLYIPRLEETNTLPSFYQEQGFTPTSTGTLIRGQNPEPVFNRYVS